jgi:hypothetical protein
MSDDPLDRPDEAALDPHTDDVNDDGLIVIPAVDPLPPPASPEEHLMQGLMVRTADVFSHISHMLNEHRKLLEPEWWSYFPIFSAAALAAYATIFKEDVPPKFLPIVEMMSQQLAVRAQEGLDQSRGVDSTRDDHFD